MSEEVKTEETRNVEAGDIIAIKPEHHRTVQAFVDAGHSATEAVRIGAEISRLNNEAMFKAIRAWHPELDGFHFAVEHETMEITVLSGRYLGGNRGGKYAGNEMVKDLQKAMWEKPPGYSAGVDEARKDS
jgi:hypothetical protein